MKTIKAIIGIGFGILLGLSLTSCAPPEGCFYKTYRFINERPVYSFDGLFVGYEPFQDRETVLVCSIEEERSYDDYFYAKAGEDITIEE